MSTCSATKSTLGARIAGAALAGPAAIIASSAPEEWVRDHLADGTLAAPMSPRFLAALAQQLGRVDDGVDQVFEGRAAGS